MYYLILVTILPFSRIRKWAQTEKLNKAEEWYHIEVKSTAKELAPQVQILASSLMNHLTTLYVFQY